MKLTVSKDLLLQYINIVNKAVSNRTTLPILECILLTADHKGFVMTGNDLEIGIKTAPIDADIEEMGEVAIEARIFNEIVRNDEMIELGKYLSKTTISTVISALQAMVPSQLKPKSSNSKVIMEKWVSVIDKDTNGLTLRQKELYDFLVSKGEYVLKGTIIASINSCLSNFISLFLIFKAQK